MAPPRKIVCIRGHVIGDGRFKRGECKACARANVSRRRNSTVSSARSRGLEYTLTPPQHDALVVAPCSYCGALPSPFNGIDRTDSRLGYVDGNVVTACWDCNRAKGQMTVAEFEVWISRVYNRLRYRRKRLMVIV